MYNFYTIDEDFRITFIPFTQEDTFSKNYEYWKTILTNELEQLVVSIKGKNFSISIETKKEPMYVVSLRVPWGYVKQCEYIFKSEFLQEKDVIVATQLPKKTTLQTFTTPMVNAYFVVKLKGDKVPPKRVMYLGEMVTARVLTNVKSCVFCYSKEHTVMECPHAGGLQYMREKGP